MRSCCARTAVPSGHTHASVPSAPREVTFDGGGRASLWHADALACYRLWPRPTVIVSDGPYGLGMFPGDPPCPELLAAWYEPHVAAWSEAALPCTTLWFWCTEIGWAEVHPLLRSHGWEYAGAHVWDKGIAHVAGNVNSATIRGFPVATEICVRYVRRPTLRAPDGRELPAREWLRSEWLRSGLPLARANDACGVADAATRKYFTRCHRWYFPPGERMEAIARYANLHGRPTTWPYFSLDGRTHLTADAWDALRAKWNHVHGVTNVWREPTVRGPERVRVRGRRSLHVNQKPLRLMRRIVVASSDPGDVVWEPFGGLFGACLAAATAGRLAYGAEILRTYFEAGVRRLIDAAYAVSDGDGYRAREGDGT